MIYYIDIHMNTILSIDIGIKNLAFCLFTKQFADDTIYKIEKWEIVNLMNDNPQSKCCFVDKNNKTCTKSGRFSKNSKCYCKTHSKKENFLIPTPELKYSFINKQKIQQLYDLADKYNIKYNKPIKKAELVKIINEYIYNSCFETIQSSNSNASKVDLITIGKNIQSQFDEIFSNYITNIDKVIIENQVSPIANRMKCIQCIVMQYFIMKNKNISIEFISSANKLKEDNKVENTKVTKVTNTTEHKELPKDNIDYAERKKRGIQKCITSLEESNTNELQTWKTFFMNHKKKDDLADCYLQGIWYITKKT